MQPEVLRRSRQEYAKEEIENLLFFDQEVRQFVEVAWKIAEDTVPEPHSIHLLAISGHMRSFKTIARIFGLLPLYRVDWKGPGDSDPTSLLEALVEDNVLTQKPRHFVKEDISALLFDELEKWLMRRMALQASILKSREMAFACSLLEKPMPPFEAEAERKDMERNLRARQDIFNQYKTLDHPFKKRIDRISRAESR